MLVIAMFILIVLSFLALFMLRSNQLNSQIVINEVYGLRAKLAAQTGIQMLLLEAFPLNASEQACNQTISSPLAYSSIEGVNGCSFVARCTTTNIAFNTQTNQYFQFSSTGTCDIAGQVVSRTVAVDAMVSN
jgi:MSHA biogenesis protein MshP